MKKIQEALENLMVEDSMEELTEAIREVNRRVDVLTLFLFTVTIGHREKCLGEKLTEENKASLADTLGLSLERMRKMIQQAEIRGADEKQGLL